MRRTLDEQELTLKMWGFPYLTWVTIVGMVALLIGMLFDDTAFLQDRLRVSAR